MIFVSKEGDLINSDVANEYFQKVKSFIDLWMTKPAFLEVKTSGSTGTPKVINISREQILASVAQTAEAFSLDEDSKIICNLPVDYISGKLMIIRALELKCELFVLSPEGDLPQKFQKLAYELQKNYGSFFMGFVPLQLQKFLESEEEISRLLNSAKSIIIGGAGISQSLLKKIQSIKAPVYHTFGMTETVTHFAIKRLNIEPDTSFRTLGNTEVKVDTQQLLWVKNECTNHQWLQTNDRVELLDDHHFIPIGRADNVINTGGIKLNLEEIEAKIENLINPEFNFFCKAVPDEVLGQKLVLFIESKEIKSGILDELKKRMPKFEAPKEVFFMPEFPKLPQVKSIN